MMFRVNLINCHSAGKFFCAGRIFRTEIPVFLGIPRSDLPDSGIHPARFPLSPLAFPWLFPTGWPHVYSERAGIPKLEGGCHSSLRLGSSGDISISHSGVSCGHRNVPHASVSHYTTSPDSSGLHRPPTRTLVCLNGSFPTRPTPLLGRLLCPAPAHPRTISLYGRTIPKQRDRTSIWIYTRNTSSTEKSHYYNFNSIQFNNNFICCIPWYMSIWQ